MRYENLFLHGSLTAVQIRGRHIQYTRALCFPCSSFFSLSSLLPIFLPFGVAGSPVDPKERVVLLTWLRLMVTKNARGVKWARFLYSCGALLFVWGKGLTGPQGSPGLATADLCHPLIPKNIRRGICLFRNIKPPTSRRAHDQNQTQQLVQTAVSQQILCGHESTVDLNYPCRMGDCHVNLCQTLAVFVA